MHPYNVLVDDIIGLESATGKPTLLLLQAKELKKPSQQSFVRDEPWNVMKEVYRKFKTLLLFQAKELKNPSQQSLPSLVNQTTGDEPWSVIKEVYRKFNLVYVYVTINDKVADDAFPTLTQDMMKGCKISVCTVTMKDIKSWCPMVAYSGRCAPHQ
eukprot:PhF_6_TR40747/c0_g2_i12/m.61356